MIIFDVLMMVSFVIGMVVIWFNPPIATIFIAGPAGAFAGITLAKLMSGGYK